MPEFTKVPADSRSVSLAMVNYDLDRHRHGDDDGNIEAIHHITQAIEKFDSIDARSAWLSFGWRQ